MTAKDILDTAKSQLAHDFNCSPDDFGGKRTVFSVNDLQPGRRIYKSDGCFFKAISFLGTAVFFADRRIMPWLEENLSDIDPAWLFEYRTLKLLDKKLSEFGQEIADVHHYYLPAENTEIRDIPFEIKWYDQKDILQYKGDERFREAFAFDETHPDVLAVSASDNGIIAGMAGASADSRSMWQIGIDVVPEYRGKGIASCLTGLLKREILNSGKVPFYGTVESHHLSKMVAYNAGFRPAWAELYTHPLIRKFDEKSGIA